MTCAPIMLWIYPGPVSPSRAAPSALPSLDVLDGNLLDGAAGLSAGVRRARQVTPAAQVTGATDAPALGITAPGH